MTDCGCTSGISEDHLRLQLSHEGAKDAVRQTFLNLASNTSSSRQWSVSSNQLQRSIVSIPSSENVLNGGSNADSSVQRIMQTIADLSAAKARAMRESGAKPTCLVKGPRSITSMSEASGADNSWNVNLKAGFECTATTPSSTVSERCHSRTRTFQEPSVPVPVYSKLLAEYQLLQEECEELRDAKKTREDQLQEQEKLLVQAQRMVSEAETSYEMFERRSGEHQYQMARILQLLSECRCRTQEELVAALRDVKDVSTSSDPKQLQLDYENLKEKGPSKAFQGPMGPLVRFFCCVRDIKYEKFIGESGMMGLPRGPGLPGRPSVGEPSSSKSFNSGAQDQVAEAGLAMHLEVARSALEDVRIELDAKKTSLEICQTELERLDNENRDLRQQLNFASSELEELRQAVAAADVMEQLDVCQKTIMELQSQVEAQKAENRKHVIEFAEFRRAHTQRIDVIERLERQLAEKDRELAHSKSTLDALEELLQSCSFQKMCEQVELAQCEAEASRQEVAQLTTTTTATTTTTTAPMSKVDEMSPADTDRAQVENLPLAIIPATTTTTTRSRIPIDKKTGIVKKCGKSEAHTAVALGPCKFMQLYHDGYFQDETYASSLFDKNISRTLVPLFLQCPRCIEFESYEGGQCCILFKKDKGFVCVSDHERTQVDWPPIKRRIPGSKFLDIRDYPNIELQAEDPNRNYMLSRAKVFLPKKDVPNPRTYETDLHSIECYYCLKNILEYLNTHVFMDSNEE